MFFFRLLLARFCVMLETIKGRGESAPSKARKKEEVVFL